VERATSTTLRASEITTAASGAADLGSTSAFVGAMKDDSALLRIHGALEFPNLSADAVERFRPLTEQLRNLSAIPELQPAVASSIGAPIYTLNFDDAIQKAFNSLVPSLSADTVSALQLPYRCVLPISKAHRLPNGSTRW
jgi:hypothetical protein